MLDMFWMMLKVFIDFLKYPFYMLLGLILIFILSCTLFIIKGLYQGKRIQRGEHRRLREPNLLKKLFWLVPKQFVDDLFNKPADFFNYQGMIIFEGRQGMGKTISMVKYMKDLQYEYPLAKCTTNLAYTDENKPLKNWTMLIDYKNGYKGVIVAMDELQNWFSSNDSRNFPPEMLSVITQNRKNRRIILGTSQNFYLLAKPIRSQATEVRRCATYLGCFTIVRRLEPILDSEGNVMEWKKRGTYCFVHDKELRESYDTWKVIENLKHSGFKENSITNVTTNTYLVNNNKKGILKNGK